MRASGRDEGIGMRARNMAEGRWVNTIVLRGLSADVRYCVYKGLTLILPKRLAIEEARSIDTAAIIEVVKKIEPSFPSSRSNLFLKNQVTHDLIWLVTSKVGIKTQLTRERDPMRKSLEQTECRD